jgi:hypothetical protein
MLVNVSTEELFMATLIAIHGNAVSFPQTPSQCEQVDGIAWTDLVGLRSGSGTTFRGRAGQFVWFHYALPSFSVVNDLTHVLSSLEVLFDVQGQATVDSVHILNNNGQPIFIQDHLQRSASTTVDTGNLSLSNDAGVSIGVSFQQAANIKFRGLNAHLLSIEPPPPPLVVAFSGTATLRTTNENAPGPFVQPFSASITLSNDRRSITRLIFTPVMTTAFPVNHPTEGPINVITTVSLVSTQLGAFNPDNGVLNLQVTLRFSHRRADNGMQPWGAGPSIANFDLTTGTSDRVVMWSPTRNAAPLSVQLAGQPRQADGQIKVVDNATFIGGFLAPAEALLEIDGRLDPVP